MDAFKILLRRYLKAAWRRRWLGLGIAWILCLTGWSAITLLPNQYRSTARIYVDTDAVLTPLLKDIAVDSEGENWVQILQQTLLSRPNIETLISKTDLDLSVTSPAARERLVDILMNRIHVYSGDVHSSVFAISYTDTNAKMAQNVVQTLINIFIERASAGNRASMENAQMFLQRQIASYAEQLRAADKRRAAFRAQYPDLFGAGLKPEDAGDPLGAVQEKIIELDSALHDKQLMAAALQKQIASAKSPRARAARAAANPELAAAEARLRILEMRYTPNFPDVVAARQEVDALKAAPSPAVGGAPELTGTTDGQLLLNLAQTNGEIAALQRQIAFLKDHETKLIQLQKQRPGLVAEYQNLDRDYGVLQAKYQELLNRLQEANIGAAADTQADKVQIRIIDPPVLPIVPVAPNRFLLISAVLAVGIAAGFALPILLSQLDSSFWVVEDLRSIGLPVVGGISLLAAPRRAPWLLMISASFGMAVLLLIAVYGGLALKALHLASVA
jgi:polysaccharide chain length determinant protein (PEP-CTERM system associated)